MPIDEKSNPLTMLFTGDTGATSTRKSTAKKSSARRGSTGAKKTTAKKTVRGLDGTSPADQVGNAGDEVRKDLGNASDAIRRGAAPRPKT